MFPTGVGMNRSEIASQGDDQGVPHRRGDEPSWGQIRLINRMCSPQAWG